MVSGPMCGQLLATLGADVIKVEPLQGEIMRTVPPHHRGESGAFHQWNCNKRGLSVDLRCQSGIDVVRELLKTADVFIENYRPGVAEEMGLGYEAVKADNPRIIYLSINGFGDTGPYANYPAYDLVVQGLTGFMFKQGEEVKPEPIRNVVADKITAAFGSQVVLAALLERQSSGLGQKVNVSMLDAYAAFILPEQMYNYTFEYPEQPNESVSNLYEVLKTADGYAIGLVARDSQFEGFMAALDRQDLRNDPRFADTAKRFVNARHLMALVADQVGRMSTKTFVEKMNANGVPFAPVNRFEDFLRDPQVQHNELIAEYPDPNLGVVRTFNNVGRFSRTPCQNGGRSPRVGEHNEEILAELDRSGA